MSKRKPVEIEIYRGDTFTRQFKIKVAGLPLDITGYTFLAQLRASADSTTILATFTCTVTDAVNGVLEMELSAATTAALDTETFSLAAWDIQWTTPAGKKKTFAYGVAKLISDVSRVP